MTRFPVRLRRLRKRARLSQQALAGRAALHRVFIARLEAGTQSPGLVSLQKLAKALGVPLAELLG